ncbi:hypothetical protein EYF80_025221 [Liparis tanakae]|uniref:Uncharacterized protein n=1 Tax=Liparis tanakae TaxID=230148 RepID=A0A4Z2HI56_9TELE|nr:hypothetical protein EYF80_025221 [Liparis tanakae]
MPSARHSEASCQPFVLRRSKRVRSSRPRRQDLRGGRILHLDQRASGVHSGAGSEHRGEGGGFLRADAAIRLQRDSDLLPAGSLLHLPQPADSTSPPSQDRCRLTPRGTQTTQTTNVAYRNRSCSSRSSGLVTRGGFLKPLM